jgi:hypothetical protein
MSNYFTIELDTTPPDFTLSLPNYTSPSDDIFLTVTANENLDSWYEAYYISCTGDRHDLNLTVNGNILSGKFKPLGCLKFLTVYVTVRDEVLNISYQQSKRIDVVTGGGQVNAKVISRKVEANVKNNRAKSTIETRHVVNNIVTKITTGAVSRIQN